MNFNALFSFLSMLLLATSAWAAPQGAGKPKLSNEAGKEAVKIFRENEKSLIEKEREAFGRVESSGKTEHTKIRDELIKKLNGLLDSETKAGNLDDAIELRNTIKYYERRRRRSSKANMASLTKEVKRLKAELSKTKPAKDIPKEAVKWNGNSYLRVDTLQCRNVAREFAESLGGYLVRIEDKDEHTFVHGLIKSTGREWYLLDGDDEHTEGKWFWTNKEQIPYLDWDKDEPTGNKTRSKLSFSHVLFMHSSTGKMHDGSGGQRAGFVIEWDDK